MPAAGDVVVGFALGVELAAVGGVVHGQDRPASLHGADTAAGMRLDVLCGADEELETGGARDRVSHVASPPLRGVQREGVKWQWS